MAKERFHSQMVLSKKDNLRKESFTARESSRAGIQMALGSSMKVPFLKGLNMDKAF